jgi:hypothetical protein
MLKKCREGERYSRIPIFSEQEYKLAASPEICLMEKQHPIPLIPSITVPRQNTSVP